MTTLYEVLKINENATRDEIDLAYSKLIYEYRIDTSNSEKDNEENRVILEKLKAAYEILIDDEKRKKYNQVIAKKRAEELIQGVKAAPKKEKTVEEEKLEYEQELRRKMKEQKAKEALNKTKSVTNTAETSNVSQTNSTSNHSEEISGNGELTEEQKRRLREAAQNKFNENLQNQEKMKQAEAEYKKAYTDAYNQYMNNQKKENFTVKLKKWLMIIGVVLVLIFILAIMLVIPPTRKILVNLYDTNPIIKMLVNVVVGIFKAIFGIA